MEWGEGGGWRRRGNTCLLVWVLFGLWGMPADSWLWLYLDMPWRPGRASCLFCGSTPSASFIQSTPGWGGPGQQSCGVFPTLLDDVNNPKGDYDSCRFSLSVSRQGQHFRYLITSKGKASSNWNKRQTNQNLLAEQDPACLSRKKDISSAPPWMALGIC